MAINVKQSLKQRTEGFTNILPFMEGREKADLKDLYGKPVTIRDFGFLKDENKESYVCFIVDEDKASFYFGGMVLTENLMNLEADGYVEEIQKEGLPILLSEKKGKSGRYYTTVEYYPEVPEKQEKQPKEKK